MKKRVLFSVSMLWLSAIAICVSICCAAPQTENGLQTRSCNVDGVRREALVFIPSTANDLESPLVFVFHGHGGTAGNVARSFAMHLHWPQAIVVYMQGLNTPGRLTDPAGKRPGWQKSAGDMGDRDLKFFDAVLKDLQERYKVDKTRIYATGHSNGGGFTYLLWAERGDVFAAVAPSAAAAGLRQSLTLSPKPAMHLAGEKDDLVRFEWQKMTIKEIRRVNSCAADGKPWGKEEYCTLYESTSGNPVVTYIHPGRHEFVRGAAPLIARFFKQHPKKPGLVSPGSD